MIIQLSPQVSDLPRLSVSVTGDVVVICGDELDLTGMPDDSVLERSAVDHDYVVGSIVKSDGTVTLRILFPISGSAPEEARFPTPIEVITDGPVVLPPTGDEE